MFPWIPGQPCSSRRNTGDAIKEQHNSTLICQIYILGTNLAGMLFVAFLLKRISALHPAFLADGAILTENNRLSPVVSVSVTTEGLGDLKAGGLGI